MAKKTALNQCSTGPDNRLHIAAKNRFTTSEHVDAILASGIDINDGGTTGLTPLMIAAGHRHSRVVTLLLDRGADVSKVADDGITALHMSAASGTWPSPRC